MLFAYLALAAGTGRAGTPLAPEQAADILARAAATGYPIDPNSAWETIEDPTILFVPAVNDAGVMLLFDTLTRGAVLVQEQGDEGYHLTVLRAEPDPAPVELDLAGDGYFRPEAHLQELGVTDTVLANVQAHVCSRVASSSRTTWAVQRARG